MTTITACQGIPRTIPGSLWRRWRHVPNRSASGRASPLSPRWRPWQLARVTATLDHLSGGRLILGVGLGDINDEGFTHFGEATNPRQRAELLDEGLDILTGLWSGKPFSYNGKHYQVEETTFLPPARSTASDPNLGRWLGRRQAGVAAGGPL